MSEVKSSPITKIEVKLTDVEPFLKFPSGLSVIKAKERAKQIKKIQDIPLNQAQLMVAWAHGCITAKSWPQALEDILREQWNFELNKTLFLFTRVSTHKYELGVAFSKTGEDGLSTVTKQGSMRTVGKLTNAADVEQHHGQMEDKDKVDMLETAFRFKGDFLSAGKKKVRFLNAVKSILKRIPESYYSLSVPTIETMESLYDCDINVEVIMAGRGCSHGVQILSEFLASIYNNNAHDTHLIKLALQKAVENNGLKLTDDDINEIRKYVEIEITGSNLSGLLDCKGKAAVVDMINNYQGW